MRGGIKKVLIPEENVRDLVDVPDIVREGLEVVPVSRMEEVVKHALVEEPKAIEWDFEAYAESLRQQGDSTTNLTAH